MDATLDERTPGRVGLVAGSGRLPIIWAREVAAREPDGYAAITAVAVTEDAYLNLRDIVPAKRVPLGRFGRTVKALRSGGAKTISFIGKVEKTDLIKGLKLDLKAARIAAGLKDFDDTTIMDALMVAFEKEGFAVLPQTRYLGKYLVEDRVYTKRRPSAADLDEIEFAMSKARALADLGIGQAVVVRRKAVLAVEAIDGTDKTIQRAARLSDGKGGTVAKAIKKGQDRRYDVPAVGLDTIRAVVAGGFRNLAVEAGSAFLIEPEKAIAAANEARVCVVGVPATVGK